MAAVVVVGSCNEDLICRTGRLPRPGETVEGKSFEACCGGKGANQAVQAALLLGPGRVEMVGCVGRDASGARLTAGLEAAGAGVGLVTTDSSGGSGVAIVTVAEAEGGINTIVVVPGANGLLTPHRVDPASAALQECRLVLCQLEVPAAASLRAFELCGGGSSSGIRVLNPAPIGGVSSDELDALVKAADLVCANELELAALTGRSDVDPATLESEPMTTTARAATALARDKSCVVLTTLGPRGALVADAAAAVHVPAWPVPKDAVLDTAGAGDSFLGALAAFVSSGKSLLAAARDAAKVASWAVARPGTQPAYASAADLAGHHPDTLLTTSLASLATSPSFSSSADRPAADPLDAVRWPLDPAPSAAHPTKADLEASGLTLVLPLL